MIAGVSAFTAILTIASMLALVPFFELWGVAAGAVIGVVVGALVYIRYFHRAHAIPYRTYLRAVGLPAVVSLVAAAPVALSWLFIAAPDDRPVAALLSLSRTSSSTSASTCRLPSGSTCCPSVCDPAASFASWHAAARRRSPDTRGQHPRRNYAGAMTIHSNETFLLSRYRQVGGTGLDYGCGDGRLVAFLAAEGADFWGAETYYGSEEHREEVESRSPEARERIKVFGDDFRIPFDDETFDFVCSNQVIEHVHDLDTTVRELARVTKPNGMHVHLFPVAETVFEAHLTVPFYNRVPSAMRRPLAHAAHRVRLAKYSREEPDFDLWFGKMNTFWEESVRLRPARTIRAAMQREFEVRHIEVEKLSFHRRRSIPALPGLVPLEHLRVGMSVELRPRARPPKPAVAA